MSPPECKQICTVRRALFLDDVFQNPVERFRKQLACPHVDDGELTRLYSKGGICGLVASVVCSRATGRVKNAP